MKTYGVAIIVFLLAGIGEAATTLFHDGFETDNLATVWTAEGTGNYYRDNTAPLCTGSYKFECGNKRYITNKTAISTVGYSNIKFNFYMAADSFEAGEYGQAQYSTDGGTTWVSVAEIRDPNDLNTFAAYNVTLPAAAANIANLKIRFRVYANANNDYLKIDEVYVLGDLGNVDNPPTVLAGANQTVTLPASTVTLTGTATDADATPVATNVWTVNSSPAGATAIIATPNALTAVVSGLTVAGDYLFRLTSTDTAGNAGYGEATITVKPQNQPPTVNAGVDVSITIPATTVALTGTATDADGTIASRLWTQTSGPENATLAGQTTNTLNVSDLTVVGDYVFTFTATDNSGISSSDTAKVTVLPSGNAGTTLFYDGFEADNLATVWTAAGTGLYYRDSTAPNVVGSYKFICTNKKYITSKNPISTVGYSNIRFNFYMAADSLEAGEYGQAQYSTDGGTTWISVAEIRDPNDLNTFAAYNVTLPAAAANIANLMIRFRIYATGNNDFLKIDEVYVLGDFKPVENPPTVNAGTNQTITLPSTMATLTGTATDTDATPVATSIWTVKSFPAGAVATIATPNALTTGISGLTIAGNYVFRLTSTDTAGNVAYGEVTIIVKPLPVNQPPTVNAGVDMSITLPNTAIVLLGSATDPDGTVASRLWTQASGPKNAVLGGQDTNTLSLSDLTVAGDYVFTLTATDNTGASSSDTAKVTVFPQPPPSVQYPTFSSIPFAIGMAVDDLGWKIWTYQQSRNATNADYQTIMDVGQAVGSRILTVWVMCDMDRSNILAKAVYNKPVAPYNMSIYGTTWNNTWQVTPNDFVLMNLVKENNAYMEFGLHGVIHTHPNASNVEVNGEYASIINKVLYQSTSWGWIDMGNRAKCFQDLIRQYFTVDEMSFPEAFVPPAHAYFYNNNDAQSTGALLSTYGIRFVNGSTIVSTTLGQGGTDHGVLFINRADGANYNWENTATQNATPWYGSWNTFDYPDYPTDAFGWAESHFPNWWGYDVNNRWVTYLKGINNAPDRLLSRNTEACSSQWLYRRNASISGTDGTYTLTINSSMPDAAYTWNLLDPITIKTPLNGLHVSSASINNGAQVVGYYEDTYGYGYLIIANPSNSIGGLAKGTYTLNAALGDTTMSTYVDMTLKTFNVYGFNTSSTQATVSLKMYGTQDVKVKTLFIPTAVSSDNPNLKINSWSYSEPFITVNVSGKNMNGETGTLTIY